MAHQIRNPCAIIFSNANLLLQNSHLKPEARRSLEAIVNGVKYLEARLEEFVEFSKPVRLDLKPYSLDHLLQQMVSMVKEKCHVQKTKISLRVSVSEPVNIDYEQMLLALLNIVINAIESIKEGGMIAIEAHPSDQKIVLTIKDTGGGIHPRDLAEIFSPFYSTKRGGIGIGLAVSKRVIDAHNGKIEVASEQGKGTVVKVLLPA